MVVEGERSELLQLLGRDAAGYGQQQEAVDVAGAQRQVSGACRRAGLCEVDEGGDDGGGQQPAALARRLGIGAERGRGRRGGQQDAVAGGDRRLDRRAVARARLLELLGAAAEHARGRCAARWPTRARRRRPAAPALHAGRSTQRGLERPARGVAMDREDHAIQP